MADYLVIVESPAKAKTIERYLGKQYRVIASKGHLRDLPASKLAVEIDNSFKPEYINISGKGQLIKELKEAAGNARAVYLATDPDREGEAISWHLENILGIPYSTVCRVTFHEITQNAIEKAFKAPRTVDLGLVDAYQARRVLDRIVGYKISPVLWKRVKKGSSAGRVQSVATRLICDREEEIEKFVPKEFWSLEARLSKKDCTDEKGIFKAKYYGKEGKKENLRTGEECDEIVSNLKDCEYRVSSVKYSQKKRPPLPPFVTSTLQQEASKRLNFDASRTMRVVQTLYEGVPIDAKGPTGLVTYIRTDSTRISDEAQNMAREYIREKYGEKYLPATKRVYKNKNAAQDAHEAIRPSHMEYEPDAIKDRLSPEQYKLYKLIFDRFVASQMADCVYDTVTADIEAGSYLFKASGNTVKFKGFTCIYKDSAEDKDKESDENATLPELSENELLNLVSLVPEQHFTQPPSRYTEATLVKAMEENGIGRPSTYAPTLAVIQERQYVTKEKKILYPTEFGKTVNRFMKENFPDIVDIDFTADIENSLDKVEQGSLNWVSMMGEFYDGFSKELSEASANTEHVSVPDEISDVPCELCGKMMVIKSGKFGKFLACPGYPQCKFTKAIDESVGKPCPKCGGDLIYRKSKTGHKFISCKNYPGCDFISWNIPTGEKCPECGSYLEYKTFKRKRFIGCSNKECKYIKPSARKTKKTGNTENGQGEQ